MPRWRWCWRRRGPGRPFNYLYLSQIPYVKEFLPRPILNPQPIELTYPEYEALRLSDVEKLTQEEIAKRMQTSRGTVWRLLESGREKIVRALVESRPLIISERGEIEKVE
ncbi:MAG TPA: DUF134 domain-containing protein [Thermococcus sp.]|nr:DUF134 domain-containing protein [Thermococcus sp.]